MSHRKWKETKQQPGTAGQGNVLGCCLVSLCFLCNIHSVHSVLYPDSLSSLCEGVPVFLLTLYRRSCSDSLSFQVRVKIHLHSSYSIQCIDSHKSSGKCELGAGHPICHFEPIGSFVPLCVTSSSLAWIAALSVQRINSPPATKRKWNHAPAENFLREVRKQMLSLKMALTS